MRYFSFFCNNPKITRNSCPTGTGNCEECRFLGATEWQRIETRLPGNPVYKVSWRRKPVTVISGIKAMKLVESGKAVRNG